MGRQPSRRTDPSTEATPLHPSPDVLAAFDVKAQAWDEYTNTPLGKLRQDLVLRYLGQHIRSFGSGLSILDVGGGTGNYALPLVRRGHRVCLLDFSATMLEIARSKIGQYGPELADQLEFRCAAVQDVPSLFPGGQFDVILCHTVLEYVAAPWQVLRDLITVLRPGGLISLVDVNRFADPLRIAIVQGDLERAHTALTDKSSAADLFGLPRRTFSTGELQEALSREGLLTVAAYGVRIFADYLPTDMLADPAVRDRLIALESAASTLDPYRAIARYIHLLGRSLSG